ncbi:MAG: thioredoxin domain-containing protein [Leptospiraceae bacterium]|nr:thioredoxin domain-containing protein [Leptospiraceae bacterium]
MEKNKVLIFGLIGFIIVYIGVTVKPLLSYYSTDNYVLINGKKYTEADLGSNPSYKKMKKDYSQNLSQVFEQFANEEILNIEAKSRGLSVEELITKESTYQPNENEILDVFKRFQAQLEGKKLDEVRPRIIQFLQGQRAQGYQATLKEKYKIQVVVDAPVQERVKVAENDNPSLGAQGAKITVIEFSDFECPYCQRSQNVNKMLREKYKDRIRWVFRDYPLPFHKNAMFAHVAANCANKQGKYWELFNPLFENTGRLERGFVFELASKSSLNMKEFEACTKDSDGKIAEEIQTDINDGQKLGVNGTPAFFINGIFVEGAQPLEAFVSIIEKELKN